MNVRLSSKHEEFPFETDTVYSYKMTTSGNPNALSKGYDRHNSLIVVLKVAKSNYQNEDIQRIIKWSREPYNSPNYYRDLSINLKTKGDFEKSIVFTHAKASVDVYSDTHLDELTITLTATQKRDKMPGVVFGRELEPTYEKAWDRVKNPLLLNITLPPVVSSPAVGFAKQETETREFAPQLASTYHKPAKLWVNGIEWNAYAINERVHIQDSGKAIRDYAIQQYAEDCLSYWKEDGIMHVTLNTVMKNSPIKLIRENSTVRIRVTMCFSGSYAGVTCLNSTKTYAELAKEGIRGAWKNATYRNQSSNGITYDKFGDEGYVVTDVTLHYITEDQAKSQPHISVKIEETGQPITWDNVNWNIASLGKATPFTTLKLFANFKGWFDGKNTATTYTADQFKNCAAHEFGHLLGLGDAYPGTTQNEAPVTLEVPNDEIMRSKWNIVVVYPNTIEMVLEAFKTNSLQKYDPKNIPSTVIRL